MIRFLALSLFLPLTAFAGARDVLNTYPSSSLTASQEQRVFQEQVLCTEVIAPSVGPISQNKADVVIDAEFLYWYAGVTQLPYARKLRLEPKGNTTNPEAAAPVFVETKEFNWKWDPGLRLGVGVITPHDGWDLYANWTYTYNTTNDQASVPDYPSGNFNVITYNPPGTEILFTPWTFLPHLDHHNRVSGHWELLFNQIDLALGRNYWISPRLSFHPFVGVRGYWARMGFDVSAFRAFTPPPFRQNQIQAKTSMKQKSWAVGLLGGIHGDWHFADQWSLFAEADIALAYGKYKVRERFRYLQINQGVEFIARNVDFHMSDNLYRLQTFVDLALGVRWEMLIHRSYRLRFDLGWESHYLFRFNQIFVATYHHGATSDFPATKGDLTLSGIAVRGRFEF